MAFHVRLYPLCITKIELFVYPPLVSVCVCHPWGWEGSMGSYDSTSLGSRAHREGGGLKPRWRSVLLGAVLFPPSLRLGKPPALQLDLRHPAQDAQKHEKRGWGLGGAQRRPRALGVGGVSSVLWLPTAQGPGPHGVSDPLLPHSQSPTYFNPLDLPKDTVRCARLQVPFPTMRSPAKGHRARR